MNFQSIIISQNTDHGCFLKSWVKLNLYYMGLSKKHHIFRYREWNKKLEKIFKKPVFNKSYEKIAYIKDIFGPINAPFISIKSLPNQEFNPNDELYTKI